MATRTPLARTAVVLALLLAVLQLFWSAFRAHGIGVGIALALGIATLLIAVVHARVETFESRLAVQVVCGVQVALMALAVVIGLPGQPRHPVDRPAVIALLLPTVVIVLLVVDQWRARRRPDAEAPSSYAL